MPRKNIIFITALIFGLAVLIIVGLLVWNNSRISQINSFTDCKNAGYPIMESYPEQCRTPDGRTFVNNVGQSVSYTGKLICLPHKDRSGPQTLECAYGLETSDGKFHGLRDSKQQVFNFQTGETVKVTGKIIETSPTQIYDIVDTVEVTSIEKV